MSEDEIALHFYFADDSPPPVDASCLSIFYLFGEQVTKPKNAKHFIFISRCPPSAPASLRLI